MRAITSLLVMICHFMLITSASAAALRESAACTRTSSVCVDGPSTKNINGVDVTKDCWEYKEEYQCLEKDSADYCAPLKDPSAKCEVQGQTCLEQSNEGECLRYTHKYSCDVDLRTLHQGRFPTKVEEMEHTHLISSQWDESSCQVQGKKCKAVATECLEPGSTKTINGVPVTRDCWKERRTVQCTDGSDSETCSAYTSSDQCRLIGDKCTHQLPDGTCQAREKQFECTEKGETTKEVSGCQDRDFAKTMTTMEFARETQRFYDPEKQRFFNGEAGQCSIKLDGALDSVFGGDCCRTKADPGKFVDFAVQTGTTMATTYFMASVASHYTFTTMFVSSAAQAMGTALSAAGGITGTSQIGALGFSAAGQQGMGVIVGFNPAVFAAAIAVIAIQQWLKCPQSEILVAMKRKADLCHYVGSYCGSKILGACVTMIESQCCFISKLAKIVNVGGKEQLKRGWGTPENPKCEGFTAQELEQLDFSKLDLSGFYEEIYANMDNVAKQGQKVSQKIREASVNGKNLEVKNYYEYQ
ncbi:TPA: conjugal transfer protein TraN [Neisseria gonorrhoeae]